MKSNQTKGPAKRRKGGPGRRPIVSITEHQRRTLREIRDFIARKGYPPTIQELAEILGITPQARMPRSTSSSVKAI
jgi:DNA-binding MarR family transcriptional regulator